MSSSFEPVGNAAMFGRIYAGARVLVLGATGFIGRRVVGALAQCGAATVATVRDQSTASALFDPHIDYALCDLAQTDQVEAVVRAARPHITFNLAGYGIDRAERDEALAYRINTELPARLAALLCTQRSDGWSSQTLVHAGSALEYGEAKGNLQEATPPLATTLYGRTKLAGTEAILARCESDGLAAVVARLFTVYGPGEHRGRLLPSLLETAQNRVPLQLTTGTQLRDFTFVDDVAEGLLRLGATTGGGAIVNLATGRLETVRGFAERAARVLSIDPTLLRFGAIAQRTEEMSHDPVDITRLRTRVGWAPETTIEEGVARTWSESG